MELRDAYIDEIACHHFSVDPSRCVENTVLMSISELDMNALKAFFITPFSSIKTEFYFSHPVGLSYNVVYQTALKMVQKEDFLKCSQDIFRYLQSVSTLPTIKDGDVFVARISDILIGNTFYDGVAIIKIERKTDFIETYSDERGGIHFSIKKGFTSNRIDKACLIVFTDEEPKCFMIDTSNETKYWRQDFLGVIPKTNSYSQSKAAIQVFQSFIKEELSARVEITKGEQVDLLNQWIEQVKASDCIQLNKVVENVIQDDHIRDMFTEYCRAFEEREGIIISGHIDVDRRVISLPGKERKIKLDDTVEITLLKTGKFMERGYDETNRMNYYKFFFERER